MKPFEVGGMLYTAEAVASLRKDMITLRDSALTEGIMEWAVLLSHNIGILNHLEEELRAAP